MLSICSLIFCVYSDRRNRFLQFDLCLGLPSVMLFVEGAIGRF